jgi:two-component system, OmpR family, response regulator RpaA
MTHLLVIEDHPDIMYILTRLLRAAGYEVSAAHDGVEGVALALQLQPDLVLLDLAIPRMDGWQVLEVLRSHPSTQHLPVLIQTASPVEHVQRRVQTLAGANLVDCIQKPWRTDALLQAIVELLATASSAT